MQYRPFKDTGIKTSLLGMGCMRLPTIGPGAGPSATDIDYEKAAEIIDYAYTHGVNYYDSAWVYNRGESEKAMGAALAKYPRDSYYIATKLPNTKCASREEILETFQESLDRMKLDYIDFYLCHNINEGSIKTFMQKHVLDTLLELKKDGKIRYLGFSAHGKPPTLDQFAKYYKWDFAQIQFNYLDYSYQDSKGQYEVLTANNIPVIVMEPVRGGRLAAVMPETDKLMKEYAPDKSIASWAIRFAATPPNVQVVLSGMSTMEQVIDNVATLSDFKPIVPEEQAIMDKAVEKLLSVTQLPCTACNYCVNDCPANLDIPGLVHVHNRYSISKSFIEFLQMRSMPEEKLPAACQQCKICVERCPQNIDIPKVMTELTDLMAKAPVRR